MNNILRPEISVVIVVWNSEDEIAECLKSVFFDRKGNRKEYIETIVIDNFSQDNSAKSIQAFKDCYPDLNIKLIANKENLGFTRGANQGLKIASGEYVMLLNPDTEISDNAIEKLVRFIRENENTGAVAPQLVFRSKDIQHSCRTFPKYRDMFSELTMLSKLFPKSKFFSRWKMQYFDHNSTREVDQPMGAALMMPSKILKEVDFLDDRFDMFFSDVDLCKKIRDKGYKIFFYHEAQVLHRKGTSVYKNRSYMIRLWNNDCIKYFKKHNFNYILFPVLSIALRLSGYIRMIFDR